MSASIYARVWEHARVGGTDLLVLLALAEHVRPGAHPCCYPSKHELARLARTSKRTVDACLARLVAAGEVIEIDWRAVDDAAARGLGKWGRSNLYVVATGSTPGELARVLGALRGADGAGSAPSRGVDGATEGAGDGATDGAASAPKSIKSGNHESQRKTPGSLKAKNMSDGAEGAHASRRRVDELLAVVRFGGSREARVGDCRWRLCAAADGHALALVDPTTGSSRRIECDAHLDGVRIAWAGCGRLPWQRTQPRAAVPQ